MRNMSRGLFIVVAIIAMGCSSPTTSDPTTDSTTATTAATTATADQAITLLAIPGVVVPVRDAAPVTTAIDSAQYTGTISWSPSASVFAASTVYTATIALTAKTGWTLSGVAANGFTVSGATATNAASSGTVTAVFPVTVALLTMITVPAGSFQRDSTATNISTISTAFKMSDKEITRAQFAAIMTTDPTSTTYSTGTSDPVQYVNWYHAIAFCNKLSIAEGLTQVYAVTGVDFATLAYSSIPTSGNVSWNTPTVTLANTGYRLPTEMEWMWAAMGAPADGQDGGTDTTGYAKGFAGSTSSSVVGVAGYAWSSGNSSSTTHPVGTKTANELGFYDMSGNVCELCWDWYAAYPTETLTDYQGATSSLTGTRVAHGGSWSDTNYAVAAFYGFAPYNQRNDKGFRVVRR